MNETNESPAPQPTSLSELSVTFLASLAGLCSGTETHSAPTKGHDHE